MAKPKKNKPSDEATLEEQPILPGTETGKPEPIGFTSAPDETPKNERVSFKLTPEGFVDFDSMRSGTKDKLASLLQTDPRLRSMAVGTGLPDGPVQLIQAKHVKGMLKVVEMLEQWLVPRLVEQQTKGAIKANPEMAAKFLSYTDEEKEEISKPGAIYLDGALPVKVRQWIANVGPGGEALGLLLMAEKRKIQAYGMAAALASGIAPAEHSDRTQVEPIN